MTKTKHKILSVFLSLCMIISCMVGMSVTAYAASNNITISAVQHGTVIASVNGSAATSAEEGATVTLTANPDNGYRLKSISGTYKGNPQETKGLNSTKTINGTYFNLSATDAAYAGWNLKNNSTITITSKNSSVKIDKVDFNIQFKGNSFNLNNVSCSAGTKSLNGSTLSVSSINGTTVTLSSSANNAGAVRFNSVTIYGTGAVDTNLTISTTGDVNVRTFTMPAVVQGDVTITPVFEEAPKYSVTLAGGANATTSGGETTQNDLTGVMTTVTYTANSGYYFAEFANITNNGITATRTNETTVTVSGTPTANASITIPDAVLAHTHSFTYSASSATITAACTDCSLTEAQRKITISAPTSLAYDGTAKAATLSTGHDTTNAFPYVSDITYTKGGAAYTGTPTDAGTYTASVSAGTDSSNCATATVTYTITKIDPTAPTDLTATYGQTLADVTLTDGWTWADSTQSVGNVGEHTFKANFAGNDNYNAASDVDVTVTVSKAANPATVTGTASVTTGGKTVDLSANVTKKGATGNVTYAISGSDLGCSVNASTGVFTSGTTAGTVTVNVTIAEDSNYNALVATPITVTISDKTAQTITASDVTATYGDTGKSVSATTDGDGAISYAVTSGADVVSVNATSGALTILKAGTATVTVTASETTEYAAATKDVTITINPADPVTPTGLTAKEGQTLADVKLPTGWTWVDSSTSVGDVGTHTFKANYTPSDTTNYNSKENVDLTVKVSAATVAVTGVTLNKTTATIEVGKTETLTATVEPSDATDNTVTWTSSDESVATVANGVVTAVKAGTATITAKAGGKTATCTVTVTASDIDISNGTVTVNTSAKTVTVTVDGNTVPADAYHIIYFTYEKIEGGETLNRVGTDFPTTAGTYIAAVVANENSGYTGENRSEPFTVSSGNSGGYTPVIPSGGTTTTTTTTNTGSFADKTEENNNYSGAEINMKSDELEKAVLTDEDKKVIDAGGTVTVELAVEEMTPTAEEKKEIETAVEAAKEASGEDYTVAMYFDANLFKTSNGTKTQLHETNGKIAVSFKLPEQFKNTDSSVTRTYAVARIHDGKTEILVCEYDPETDLLTFYTDKFSTYALMYEDTAVETADVSAAGDKTLTATVSRTGNVKLSWSVQTGAQSYSVYQAKDGKWVKLGTTSKTTYTVKNLTNNKTYKFMLRAKVNGKLVAKADAMTLKVKVYFKPAIKLTAKKGSITIKWNKVPEATKYRVYKYVNGSLKLITATTKNAVRITGTKAGTKYSYAVKAYIDGKWTKVSKSDIASVTAK